MTMSLVRRSVFLVGAFVAALVGCGDDEGSAGDRGGVAGVSASSGIGGHEDVGLVGGASGTGGGASGSGGGATDGSAEEADVLAAALVGSGQLGKSPRYRMVFSVGEHGVLQEKMMSSRYRLSGSSVTRKESIQ